MNKLDLLKYFCLKSILSYNFDLLEINKTLKYILDKSIKNKDIIHFSKQSNLFNHYKIINIIHYHSKSKCIFLEHPKHDKTIFIISISKSYNNNIINFLSNPNRLKFKCKELDFINKKNCIIFEGIYNEIFDKLFYKQYKEYIKNYNNEYHLIFVGYSINGITSLFLAYLTSIIINNKINVYSFAIPKFCNQNLIDLFEKKNNLNIHIINYLSDPVQLFVYPFTLNFKNIFFLKDKSYFIHDNKEKNQDIFIKEHFSSYLSYFTFNKHLTSKYFNLLIEI